MGALYKVLFFSGRILKEKRFDLFGINNRKAHKMDSYGLIISGIFSINEKHSNEHLNVSRLYGILHT